MTENLSYTIQIGTDFDLGQDLVWTLKSDPLLRANNVSVPRPKRYRRILPDLVEGDEALFNQYGVIVVSGQKCASVKTALAETFSNWLRSPAGQSAIAAYRRNGKQLFFPNAKTE